MAGYFIDIRVYVPAGAPRVIVDKVIGVEPDNGGFPCMLEIVSAHVAADAVADQSKSH